jgi:ABC-type multidrug transport system ATPase subunit
LHDVERTCQTALLLNRGEIIYYGTLAEMKADRQNNFEIRVRDNAEPFAALLKARGAEVSEDRGNRLIATLPDGQGAEFIFAAALEAKVQLRHLVPHHRTLETAFLSILDKQPKNAAAPIASQADAALLGQ